MDVAEEKSGANEKPVSYDDETQENLRADSSVIEDSFSQQSTVGKSISTTSNCESLDSTLDAGGVYLVSRWHGGGGFLRGLVGVSGLGCCCRRGVVVRR